MRDKRPVDELSIEELERILAIRKREEREKRMHKLRRDGRVVDGPIPPMPVVAALPQVPPAPVPTVETNGSNHAELAPPPPAPSASPGAGIRFEDDPYDVVYSPERVEGERVWRRFTNGLLTVIEIVAVLGLIYIGWSLYQAVGDLEQETASAAALADEQRRAGIPTIAPTPQVTLEAVVLPGGHVFSESGAPQFNFSEIPAHLLPMVQDQIVAPPPRRPPPTDETALRLIIPKIRVDQTIVQGVDWEALRLGIGQLQNGVDPTDDAGNVVLAAHNDIYGEYFRYLDELEAGDQFEIHTRSQVHTYTVTEIRIVEPNDVAVMNNREGSTATLISCYPYQVNDKRIVVFADRTA